MCGLIDGIREPHEIPDFFDRFVLWEVGVGAAVVVALLVAIIIHTLVGL